MIVIVTAGWFSKTRSLGVKMKIFAYFLIHICFYMNTFVVVENSIGKNGGNKKLFCMFFNFFLFILDYGINISDFFKEEKGVNNINKVPKECHLSAQTIQKIKRTMYA